MDIIEVSAIVFECRLIIENVATVPAGKRVADLSGGGTRNFRRVYLKARAQPDNPIIPDRETMGHG